MARGAHAPADVRLSRIPLHRHAGTRFASLRGMPGRFLSVNAAAVSLIAICILAAAILVAVTTSDHPAVVSVAAVTPVATPAVHPVAAPAPHAIEPQPAGTSGTAAGTAASSQQTAPSRPVTLTGCLQRDGQSFHLTDTEGTQAPKSRSWKSGFLKKGNAAVAVVDTGKRLNLPRHVNERVDVTGVLSGHSMQARSLTRVAAKCS